MKKLVLLDMDGTVYLGDKLFNSVPRVFDFFNKNNIDYVFLTNNSSHSIEFLKNKMAKMGVKCSEKNFYTSIEATIRYLKNLKIKSLYVLGVGFFKEELSKHFNLVEKLDLNNPVDAVVASFDTEVNYDELKIASLYLQKGSKFIATNMDYRCPIEDGLYVPDCGGICKLLEMASNVSPIFIGKPAPEMIYQVMDIYGVKKDEVIMVGDRYYTDIMAGINAGVDTLAVLTGETTKEEFEKSTPKPTYIKNSIEDLINILINNK